MKTSESIKGIANALLLAQSEISFAAKNSQNPHFKNKYADLPAVIDAVKEALNRNLIVFIQSASPSDDGKLHLTTRLLHNSGEWIEDTAVCPLPKSDPQGFGSAMTYLRRYCLASMLGLYQDDDDGEAARATAPVQPQKVFVDTGEMILKIDAAQTVDDLRKAYIESVQAVNGDQIALRALEKAKDKRKTELEAA